MARVVNTTAAKTALGALYPAAADRGAAMTDDQLVAYLDRTVAGITSKPISRATLFRDGCGERGSASSLLKRAGSSRCGTCPTPSYQEASAVGQVARMWSAIAGRTTVSERPCVTSSGTSSDRSTSS